MHQQKLAICKRMAALQLLQGVARGQARYYFTTCATI